MQPLRFICRRPGTLLAIVATAFAGWVWYDVFWPKRAGAPNEIPRLESVAVVDGEMGSLPKRMLPKPPLEENANPQIIARMLPKLKPGMTRTEVEGLVGLPAPQDIHPATVTEG